ncbi:protein Mabiki-like isoform X2 [Musca domestica]|nr:protein Mabiki-like isoform X2 [Musca domestica]
MAELYQHKKFNLKAEEEYSHKKFAGAQQMKRKRENIEDKENIIITADLILEKAQREAPLPEPPIKRKQIKPLFRPWEIESSKDNNKINTTPVSNILNPITPNILPYHPNMVRHHNSANKPRTEKEQERRNRNTLACLLNRRRKQQEQQMLQQQYILHQQQHVAMMEQSLRSALYLRHLQQLAWQRQQQLFVFGQ